MGHPEVELIPEKSKDGRVTIRVLHIFFVFGRDLAVVSRYKVGSRVYDPAEYGVPRPLVNLARKMAQEEFRRQRHKELPLAPAKS